MDWDAIGAMGEIVGAIAVVATLGYLAVQIRHNTRASAVEAKLATTGMLTEFVNMLIADPQLNDLFMRGRTSTKNLSKDESQRFSNMVMKTFWFGSAAHFQLRTGTLDEDDFFEIKAILQFWLEGKGVREWWQRHGHQRFAKTYAEFIDAELRRVEAQESCSLEPSNE